MRKGFLKFIGIILWNALTLSLYANTTWVQGIISTNTVWAPAGSPYIVIGNVLVDSGVTLDIEPGVEVKIDSVKYIMVKGNLYAIGTQADSILITRRGTARWQRLWFKTASRCSLKYCRIEYADNSAIYKEGSDSIYICHNTISNS
ncbi:MAG: hypothetical protein HY769_07430 [Candidatus Stahlbacteria bacterium]|nr:hypothetical protein [Candidatus Stahlbacteria bacterium]